MSNLLNPLVPTVLFVYPLETLENRKVLWYFQGVEKECGGNKWVKLIILAYHYIIIRAWSPSSYLVLVTFKASQMAFSKEVNFPSLLYLMVLRLSSGLYKENMFAEINSESSNLEASRRSLSAFPATAILTLNNIFVISKMGKKVITPLDSWHLVLTIFRWLP